MICFYHLPAGIRKAASLTEGVFGRKLAAVVLAALFMAPVSGAVWAEDGTYEEAVAAYEDAAYETAHRQFRRLAELGHSGAETMLGVMYYQGDGVEKNNGFAAAWFYKAARRGNPSAQLALGAMHMSGQGVPADLATAYKWLSLAAQHGTPEIIKKASRLLADVSKRLDLETQESVRAEIRAWKADPRIDP